MFSVIERTNSDKFVSLDFDNRIYINVFLFSHIQMNVFVSSREEVLPWHVIFVRFNKEQTVLQNSWRNLNNIGFGGIKKSTKKSVLLNCIEFDSRYEKYRRNR